MEELISAKGVIMIIIHSVIFPQVSEIKAYYNSKEILNKLCEIMAMNRYGKSKKDIYIEILNIKTVKQIKEFVNKIYGKYIFPYDVINVLNERNVRYE